MIANHVAKARGYVELARNICLGSGRLWPRWKLAVTMRRSHDATGYVQKIAGPRYRSGRLRTCSEIQPETVGYGLARSTRAAVDHHSTDASLRGSDVDAGTAHKMPEAPTTRPGPIGIAWTVEVTQGRQARRTNVQNRNRDAQSIRSQTRSAVKPNALPRHLAILARAGYASRGIVYVIVGALTTAAAVGSKGGRLRPVAGARRGRRTHRIAGTNLRSARVRDSGDRLARIRRLWTDRSRLQAPRQEAMIDKRR